MKTCAKCKELKCKSHFHKQKISKDGLQSFCKYCKKSSDNNWKAKLTDKEKILKRERNSKHRKERYNSDVDFKIACTLRRRLNCAIKDNQKTGSAINDLGCSIEEFKKYIENQFEPWMNWDNWGNYDKNNRTWHLDHINPLDNFDLKNREEMLKAANYNNYRPLLALDNLKKGNRSQYKDVR